MSVPTATAREPAARRCERRRSAMSRRHVSKWYGQVIGLNDVTVSCRPA
jgi:hypothetical protein